MTTVLEKKQQPCTIAGVVLSCYNCGEPLELDFYWIVNRNGDQLLGVDADFEKDGDEWIEFEVCKNCHAAQ